MAAQRSKTTGNIDNTGFGTNSNAEGGRLTNKDGSINLQRTGIPFFQRISLYHTLLRMPRLKFLLCVFLFYTVLNIFFATIYIIIGVENLQGVHAENEFTSFQAAFFFSSQTLTTVGYGHISPVNLWANIIASLESFIGILSFAVVTGLLYGRFTRPKAYMRFSQNVLIAPHKGIHALMARVATYKNTHLTDVDAQVTLAMHIHENGKRITRFFPLELEIKKINSLALNWTIVHLINEDSPLYQMTLRDIQEADIELIYHLKGFDDHFSNVVQQRTSYTFNELVYGARFLPMYHRSEDGSTTVLSLDKINAHEPAPLPELGKSAYNA
ncbi:MAG: Inward rectifier potassium channel Irk [Sphingobacteriales bacterium]|nr:MAG: Inward rectifier potassium channel Irk [Sphingobacteriales bacterium]